MTELWCFTLCALGGHCGSYYLDLCRTVFITPLFIGMSHYSQITKTDICMFVGVKKCECDLTAHTHWQHGQVFGLVWDLDSLPHYVHSSRSKFKEF